MTRAAAAGEAPRRAGWGRLARTGGMLATPRAALAALERTSEGSGMIGDVVIFILLRFVATRLRELVVIVWAGFEGSGRLALPQILQLLQQAVFLDLVVILGAAVVISVGAGRRRRADRDIELGAACWLPLGALGTAAELVNFARPGLPQALWDGVVLAGLAWTLGLVVLAITAARRRELASS
ncbi:MAG: hypothetical protein IT370_01715 [Deltaproteobacteria bacterium]|nr:hypothetical protein [Deltaproteobacteria bacterium]